MGDDLTPGRATVDAASERWLEHVKAARSEGTYRNYAGYFRNRILPASSVPICLPSPM
jgi:Phage integrase, N-terminal SAM-like domain